MTEEICANCGHTEDIHSKIEDEGKTNCCALIPNEDNDGEHKCSCKKFVPQKEDNHSPHSSDGVEHHTMNAKAILPMEVEGSNPSADDNNIPSEQENSYITPEINSSEAMRRTDLRNHNQQLEDCSQKAITSGRN